ncbi:cytochrome P450 [Hypoxylon sp. FL0543]|nr:cytochrome P450 [Hypoxylon sp. FL0543]
MALQDNTTAQYGLGQLSSQITHQVSNLTSSYASSPSAGLVTGVLVIGIYLLYWWALPKPIPGIPYNKESARSLFGDVNSLVQHTKKTNRFYDWLVAQNIKLQSPIVQVFARPFAKPWVIIADFPETYDILIRRPRVFDRSRFFTEISGGITPENHFRMHTDDEFKRHRRWVQGLMTPGFLHDVASPHIYNISLELIQLWEEKARLAQGFPFRALQDMHRTALDAIWTIVFGADSSKTITKSQLDLYTAQASISLPDDPDKKTEVVLPSAPYPTVIQAILTITGSAETSLKSPVPKLAHWMLRQTRRMKEAFKIKDKFIEDEIRKALDRYEESHDSDVTNAIDDIIRREMVLAEKEKRDPVIWSRGISDEIFGLLIAAHDTTGTAMAWGLKHLADNQHIQDKLRSELQSAHAEARKLRRFPTVDEILGNPIPYLEATVEEIIRCSLTESAVMRTAMMDVNVLGHRIPKGTEVFFMGNGPSVFMPAFDIDDSIRSPNFDTTKDRVGSWDPKDMGSFKPERWLVDEEGRSVFDPAAGPLLTFGLGERGCYGRKLSYIEMRIFLTLIIWNFELHKCPPELSGYEAYDKMTHGPAQCFVKLVKVTS